MAIRAFKDVEFDNWAKNEGVMAYTAAELSNLVTNRLIVEIKYHEQNPQERP